MNHGALKAHLELQDGVTVLVHQQQRAPLKLCRTLPAKVSGATDLGLELCVMDVSPGLLDGDTAELSFAAGPGTRAVVTSQGFTRVHPCPRGAARSMVNLRVAKHAVLCYLPDATILFKDAELHGELSADIEPGGALICLETLGAGRIARGESFDFRAYRSQLQLRHGVHWSLCAQTWIEPAKLAPRGRFAWDTHTHWANLYLVHHAAQESWCEATRTALLSSSLQWGTSILPGGGIAVSLLGDRAHDLRLEVHRLAHLWSELLGDRPELPGPT